jgi:hypothetical protein
MSGVRPSRYWMVPDTQFIESFARKKAQLADDASYAFTVFYVTNLIEIFLIAREE